MGIECAQGMVELQGLSLSRWGRGKLAGALAGVVATAQAGRMRDRPSPAALAESYVISLRPVGGHATLRRLAARHGARLLALSPCRLEWRDDPQTRADLRAALAASHVLVTSPAAVRAAHALQPLQARRGQQWFAVGSGTAAALGRAGIADVAAPTRMDSEGLLALPGLRELAGIEIGMLSAPGGRGQIVPTLQQRGAHVLRADIYARVPIAPSPLAIAKLRSLAAPAWLLLSSGEALQHVLARLPADAIARLRTARVVAASARLAELAQANGFDRVIVAADARPRSLLDAAAESVGKTARARRPAH